MAPLTSPMSLIADIQVVPSPTGTEADCFKHVNAAIAVITASGLKHSVGALGTTVEGRADAVWRVAREAFDACLKSGAEKELMYLKLYRGDHTVSELEESGAAAAAAARPVARPDHRPAAASRAAVANPNPDRASRDRTSASRPASGMRPPGSGFSLDHRAVRDRTSRTFFEAGPAPPPRELHAARRVQQPASVPKRREAPPDERPPRGRPPKGKACVPSLGRVDSAPPPPPARAAPPAAKKPAARSRRASLPPARAKPPPPPPVLNLMPGRPARDRHAAA